MKYKKGDWVVFPDYNKYPVQLEDDESLGLKSYMHNGSVFVKLSVEQAKEAGVNLQICVRDPRAYPAGWDPNRGWVDFSMVRFATKKDFASIVKSAKNNLESCKKVLKMYQKAMRSL